MFFVKNSDLPAYTFLSWEAIEWAVKNIENLQTEANAEILFQSILVNDHIRHASGDLNQSFKRGSYLYCIMDEANKEYFKMRRVDIKAFERDWMEVGVVHQHNPKYYDNFYEESSEIMSHNYKFENSGIKISSYGILTISQ